MASGRPALVSAADRAALEARARAGFRQRFGRDATLVASAPGRVNLIGEHTDYNGGLVLPMAIARRTAVAAAPRASSALPGSSQADSRRVRIASALADGVVELDLDAPIARGEPRWGDYVRGVLHFATQDLPAEPALPGFDAWVDSDVPVGAGLSSSAALEVAMATALEGLWGLRVEPIGKALLCQRAEREFAGVPCGVMDQAASVLADEQHALLLDCRDLAWERVALPAGLRVVVVDSHLPHDLGAGEFARRVRECDEAARLLGLASLRDADADAARELARAGHDVLARRVQHVVAENARVREAVAAMRAGDARRLGEVLDDGHASLRDLYEVSRPEMDELVQTLRRAGALGARMTGGGFGGCVVALVEDDAGAVAALERALR